jgi:hypothetical protein
MDPSGLLRLLAGVGVALLPLITLVNPATGLEVILMRHADKDVSRGDYNLSPAGFARAIALARLIPACLGAPTGITTFFLDPQTSKNARSYQSAVPLAVATGLEFQALQHVRFAAVDTPTGCVEVRMTRTQYVNLQ